MKKIILTAALVVLSLASFVSVRPAAAQSGRINLGPIELQFHSNGISARNYNPGRPCPGGLPQVRPETCPQPSIPACLQGEWVEQCGNGAVWYHRLSACGTHEITMVAPDGRERTVTCKATFCQGTLTLSGGKFCVSPPRNGCLKLCGPDGQCRYWNR